MEIIPLVAGKSGSPDDEAEVVFIPAVDVEKASRAVPGYCFLPQERWPVASQSLSALWVARFPLIASPPWACVDAEGAWIRPDDEEFSRILEGKRRKAQGYALKDMDLWLLIVCDTLGDLESHVFPEGQEGVSELEATIGKTGFDFLNGPFTEVWLLSAFTREPAPDISVVNLLAWSRQAWRSRFRRTFIRSGFRPSKTPAPRRATV